MGKVSEIMLLKQPKQSALAVEVHTGYERNVRGYREELRKIDSLFKAQGRNHY